MFGDLTRDPPRAHEQAGSEDGCISKSLRNLTRRYVLSFLYVVWVFQSYPYRTVDAYAFGVLLVSKLSYRNPTGIRGLFCPFFTRP